MTHLKFGEIDKVAIGLAEAVHNHIGKTTAPLLQRLAELDDRIRVLEARLHNVENPPGGKLRAVRGGRE